MADDVAEGEFELVNQLGLHARAAAQLVNVANRHKCEVWVECDGQKVNAKSIMGLLSLAAGIGMKLKVYCRGAGAPLCLEDIRVLIANRFGEAK